MPRYLGFASPLIGWVDPLDSGGEYFLQSSEAARPTFVVLAGDLGVGKELVNQDDLRYALAVVELNGD